MNRYRFYIVLFTLFINQLNAQKIEIGGDWTGYDFSYFCPSYVFSNEGKTTTPLDILGPNHISLAGKDCLIAIEKAKEYIHERGGTDFLKRTDFYDIDITFPDSVEAFKNKKPLYDLIKCGETKYFVRFIFRSEYTELFRFGIALNDKFEILSPLDFPDINKNPDFYKVMEPLDVYKIALKKHKKLIKDAECIVLSYDESLGAFIWNITGQKKEEAPKSEKQTKIIYHYGFVTINAVTGEILYAAKNKGYLMRNPRYF